MEFLLIPILLLIVGAAVLIVKHAGKLMFVVLSRPFSLLIIIYLITIIPSHNKTYIGTNETRQGSEDYYETEYLDEPTIFEDLFGEHAYVVFPVMNSLMVIFILYLFFVCKKLLNPFIVLGIEIDYAAMLAFSGIFLFLPFEPIIKFLPNNINHAIITTYLIVSIIWFIACNEAKHTYLRKFKKEVND